MTTGASPRTPAGVDRGRFPSEITPFDDAEFRVRMGLRRLDPAQWIEVDSAYEAQVNHKRELYRDRYADVVVALDHPRVEAAARELHACLDLHLRSGSGSGSLAATVEPIDAWPHPIAAVGLSTQEDWCVLCRLEDTPESPLVMGCASVCFPTRWVLTEKLGLTTREIHAPVPFYEEQVGAAVDRFFDRITVERPVWRVNWNLCDDDALHQPYVGGRPDGAVPTVEDVGDRVWLRIERQTLRRLPESGAVVFGIRVHHQPLVETARTPEVLGRLQAALAQLPDAVVEYKGLIDQASAIQQWCRTQLEF